jgi:hypothetical protein
VHIDALSVEGFLGRAIGHWFCSKVEINPAMSHCGLLCEATL